MRNSKYREQIALLSKKPVFTSAEANKAGVPPRMLSYFCEKGLIQRLSRGVYSGVKSSIAVDIQWEDLALTALSIPRGVICLISALSFYGMTDQIMREFWIAVPNSSKSPRRPKTRIIRMRNTELGLRMLRIGGEKLKIFDRERTVVDSFRYLDNEIAIKALKAYLKPSKDHKPDLDKLYKYSKVLRFDIQPYIQTILT